MHFSASYLPPPTVIVGEHSLLELELEPPLPPPPLQAEIKIVAENKNKKLNKAIQKRHNKVKNKRKDFCHKLSRKIVNKYSKIFVEDLNINAMKEDMKRL